MTFEQLRKLIHRYGGPANFSRQSGFEYWQVQAAYRDGDHYYRDQIAKWLEQADDPTMIQESERKFIEQVLENHEKQDLAFEAGIAPSGVNYYLYRCQKRTAGFMKLMQAAHNLSNQKEEQ